MLQALLFIIPIALAVAVFCYTLFVGQPKSKIAAMKTWATTQGRFIQIHPYEGFITDFHTGKKYFREPYQLYEYTVSGKRYENTIIDAITYIPPNRLQPNITLIDVEDAADKATLDYHNSSKIGDVITVYYDPRNPQQSALVRHDKLPNRNRYYFNFCLIMILSFSLLALLDP